MDILAHRGFWKTQNEKNSLPALINAIQNGYGIETDIRDYCGKLVISHNVPNFEELLFEEFLEQYFLLSCNTTLAINIKADGLQNLIINLLEKYDIKNYFLFDMSVPEMVVYDKLKLVYFSRHSDIETNPVMYDKCSGIWLDAFYNDDIINEHVIINYIKSGKTVCIVSPELHGKEYHNKWSMLKNYGIHTNEKVFLCTDYPEEARYYFNE